MAEKSELQIIFVGKDGTKKIFKEVGKNLDDMQKKNKEFARTAEDSYKQIAAGAAVLAAGVLAAKKVFDFSQEGAQLIRLKKAGNDLAASMGQDMKKIVAAMQEASLGTVSNADAMALATKAMQLGVAKTPEEFDKLATASIALGRAMGRGPIEAITDIVTGVGRMSPLILDNLGIMTKGGKIFDEYAAKVGKTADQLTDTEKKQILLNSALESAQPLLDENGNLVEDLATQYERLDRVIKDTGDAIKAELALSLQNIIPNVDDLNKAYLKEIDIMSELNVHRKLFSEDFVYQGKVIASSRDELFRWYETMQMGSNFYEDAGNQARELGIKIDEVTDAQNLFSEATKSANIDLGDFLTKNKDIIKWYQSEGFQIYLEATAIMDGLANSTATGAARTRELKEAQQQLNALSRQSTQLANREWVQTSGYSTARTAPTIAEQRGIGQAGGGQLSGFNIVGERGWEFVIGNTVIPHELSKKLASLGIQPSRGLAIGGTFDPGEVTTGWDIGNTIDPNPAVNPPPATYLPTLPSIPAPTVQETVSTIAEITEAVTQATTEQTTRALAPLVTSQTQVVASGMNLQNVKTQQTNDLLNSILKRLSAMPSVEDYRQIMLETNETGGF